MSELHIISNYHARDILRWGQLTGEEQEEFDWIEEEQQNEHEFFRYKQSAYCLADFMRIANHPDEEFSSWDGYSNDTFFSGILVKYPSDEWGNIEDGIIVGWYYC